jgi:hypothetical protein
MTGDKMAFFVNGFLIENTQQELSIIRDSEEV